MQQITQSQRLNQKLKQRLLLSLVAIAIGISGGLGILRWRSLHLAESRAATATLPTRQLTVVALGRVAPLGEVIDVGGLPNTRVAQLKVAVGDRVQKGDVLAYLDSYEERLAQRNLAASQLAEAKRQLQGEVSLRQAQIREAQSRLHQVNEPARYEILSQQAQVADQQAQVDLAQVEVNRFQSLRQAGAVSQQAWDQQLTQLRQRQEELNAVKAKLTELSTSRQANLQTTQAQIETSEASLAQAQAQTTIASATRNLELAEAQLARTIIRAPRTGEVLRILTYPGEALASESLGEKQSILQLGETQQMVVVAEVYETDISRVKLGQPAKITSRSYTFSGSLTGTVDQVGQQILKNGVIDNNPAANTDARIAEVTIRLDDSTAVAQLTNLQVDVEIQVAPSP